MCDERLREARERAMRLLARREHSVAELRGKLQQRGLDPDAIDGALADLQSERLLSDERFAAEFVRSRRQQGHGPIRIRAELGQRGVANDVAATVLGDDREDDTARAIAQRCKRFGEAPPADPREYRRQYRYLANRGFTSEQIRSALGTNEND